MKSRSSSMSIKYLALTAGLVFAGFAQADSSFQSNAGAQTANAHLDFRITVPKVLYLRVGTGTNMAANSGINLIDFVVPAANVGDATAVTATAASGDLASGAVTARVIANGGGNVSFTNTTTGALTNGTDTISFSEIGVATAALTTGTILAHPTLADGAASAVTTLTAANGIVKQDAKWTFTYKNTNVVAAGTYGGVNVQAGRVVYTASQP